MEVGLILTGDALLNSTAENWEEWNKELLDFLEVPKEVTNKKDEEKADGYSHSFKDCFEFLKTYLPDTPKVRTFSFLFEYMPPLRNNRRMDTVILLDTKEIVLEFKATKEYTEEEMIQANGYVHYLKTSHDVTLKNHMEVEGYLVRTKGRGRGATCEIGTVLDGSNFTEIISQSIAGHGPNADVAGWVESETTTIPSIMDAVHLLYTEGKKKEIRYLKDGDLGESLPFINRLIDQTQVSGGKSIIMVDGVPGSGKTYLGTQVAFERKTAKIPSVYISGNAPLINYMQTILSPEGSRNIQDDCPFVVGMKTFKHNFIQTKNRPQHGVIVFDEAQRAWDQEKMGCDYSEIEGLLQFGDRAQVEYGSCMILCLFGIGQAIHEGEEQGLRLWEDAIKKHPDWEYHVSNEIRTQLHVEGKISVHKELHLSTAIRNNFIDLSDWIDAVIENRGLEEQKKLLIEAKKKGFKIRVCRHLTGWRKKMHEEVPEETYGVLASSFVGDRELRIASQNNVEHSYMSANDAGDWFLHDCKNMDIAASEFVCQGLELDWPFVIFGGDFYLKDGKWNMEIPPNKRKNLINPEEILKNIYRILLSRGRKGLFLVIPEGTKFEETYKHFRDMEIRPMTATEKENK